MIRGWFTRWLMGLLCEDICILAKAEVRAEFDRLHAIADSYIECPHCRRQYHLKELGVTANARHVTITCHCGKTLDIQPYGNHFSVTTR